MEREETWRWVVTLQMATAVPAISYTYIIPYAGHFVTSSLYSSLPDSGLSFGLFIGSYTLGRAVTTPVWLWIGHKCGRRPLLQICLLIQFLMTLCFGLSTNPVNATIIRIVIGAFAPGYALARSMLMEIAVLKKDYTGKFARFAVYTHSISLGAGLLIGSFAVREEELPYLEASLIDIVLLLFVFVVISTDFPEIEKKELPPIPEKAEKQTDPEHKFEEFTGEETQNSVEDQKAIEEEDIPSYLAQYATPVFPQLSVLKSVIAPDSEDSIQIASDPVSLDSGVRIPMESFPVGNGVKRTHISFVDEDISVPRPSTVTLDDPFKRKAEIQLFRSTEFYWSLALYLTLVYATATVEAAGLLWLLVDTAVDMSSPREFGLLLSAAAAGTAIAQGALMSTATGRVPLNKTGIWSICTMSVTTAGIPFALLLGPGCPTLIVACLLLVFRDTMSRIMLTTSVLKVADSVHPDIREEALCCADGLGCLMRGLGTVSGPALLTLGFHTFPDLRLVFSLVSGALFLFPLAIDELSRKYFPRFSQAPYLV